MAEELNNILDDDGYDVDLSDLDLDDLISDDEEEETEEDETEEETAQTDGSEEQPEEQQKAEEDNTANTNAENDPAPAEELFELKYNKQTRNYTRAEVTELAQKGMNYDHVLQQRDNLQNQLSEAQKFRTENEETLSILKSFAESSGKSIEDFVRSVRENKLVSEGMSREAAKERIRAEDAERKLAKQQAERETQSRQQKEASDLEARQRADAARFEQLYPDAARKAKSGEEPIPQEVWNEVANGSTLCEAYSRYENKKIAEENRKLQEQLKVKEQNNKTKAMSLGSAKSDGKDKAKDPFLEALFADD